MGTQTIDPPAGFLAEATRTLTAGLGDKLKNGGVSQREGEQLRRKITRDILLNADALAGIILSLWTWVNETLEAEGFEGRDLAGKCQVLLDGIDMTLTGHARLLEMAKEVGLAPEATGLRDLEIKLPALREARPRVAELLSLANRPPRPVDESRLAEGRAARERGDVVTVDDDFIARLRAGEDI